MPSSAYQPQNTDAVVFFFVFLSVVVTGVALSVTFFPAT